MNARLSSLAGASLCALALATPAVADAPAGYYDSLEGKTGVALKKAVKATLPGTLSVRRMSGLSTARNAGGICIAPIM